MANQVVIVGDHEQVSPSAVGQKIEEVNYLIEEHLQGIPNNHLYDGKTSIYDLARQSFGGTIGLREHFRCVPEIIQFSNGLSYNFEIKPLREASEVDVKPHVVEHRVQGATYENKVNEKEALRVASLVAAATEDRAYQGKTMGVISLVGEKQAERIEKLLRDHLDPVVYEKEHRIMAGNPAQFQGDERDVMFLSVVNAPKAGGGPLRKRTRRLFKQRFNVAASRARDQMWVVHSLNPRVDLKEGDLRRRLIEHAQDPSVLMRRAESEERETESEFERQVLRKLRAEGYRVEPQWEVGAYRIDLVVVGSDGTKLAVECDGERYHPPEKLSEDMERQAILERLGWTFVRIRGSLFFRDPDRAMAAVYERLEEMGISRAGREPSHSTDEERSDVEKRIVRRAAKLRRAWTGDEEAGEEWSESGETTGGSVDQETRSFSHGPSSANGEEAAYQGKKSSHSEPSAEGPRQDGSVSGATADLFSGSSDQEVPASSGGQPAVTMYDRVEDIPEEDLGKALYHFLPGDKAVQRERLLNRAAAALGFSLAKQLRSRMNKYIRRQIDGGELEQINDWEKVRRAR